MNHRRELQDSRTRALLFGGAAAAYACTATPGAFWLDSSELAGAGISLGIPHAPGHPLYVILAHAASLVPVGAIGFRVAMLSALCAALAVALTHALVCELTDEGPRWPATLAAVALGLSQAVWLQAVRAEVYTLELALALGLLLVALRWSRAPRPRPAGPPLAVAFAAGLAAGNHHLLFVFHLPALVALLLGDPDVRRSLGRRLPLLTLAGLWGFSVYLLLPLRARLDPLFDYGDPSSPGRLLDVITARVFMRSVSAASTPISTNLVAALGMLCDAVGPVLLAGSAVGLVALARRRPLWALALALALVGNLATKVTMDLDPTNPDAAGYLEAGVAIVAICGALALSAASRAPNRLVRGGVLALALLTVSLLCADAGLRLARTDLADYRTPQALDTALLQRVEPDALVLDSFFALHFNRLYQHAAEGVRPDVLTVHQGFEDHIDGGRPLAARLRARDPRLAPVLDAFLATGAFPTEALLRHAALRPVYVEPTLGLPFPPDRLAYAGGLFRVLPAPFAREPDADAALQSRDQGAILALAPAEWRTQREARTTLSLLWLQLAVVRLQQGFAKGAQIALGGVAAISPELPQLARLRPTASALEEATTERARRAISGQDFGALFR
ncbi:MAG: DUF2723 domain-containing protein [Deltaproteobacteria bacterium]|nr:DUF2723 domain-containing protein [Deltaproteobacteria bacterium]MCB9785832.1 DUF2723 domain-containing protein [Deltaproteobacteria bacterium]